MDVLERRQRSPVVEHRLVVPAVVVRRREVARCGDVDHALSGQRIDRLRDRALLEVRLVEEGEVVDDHARAGRRQLRHAVDHVTARARTVERERCARREIVHDLEHRRALALALPRLQHLHVGRQVRGGDRRVDAVHAVGEHADRHALPRDAERLARLVGPQDRVTLREDAAGARQRRERRLDGLDEVERREVLDGRDRRPSLDEAMGSALERDVEPTRAQRRALVRRQARHPHADVHPARLVRAQPARPHRAGQRRPRRQRAHADAGDDLPQRSRDPRPGRPQIPLLGERGMDGRQAATCR